jgi:hypothetical protein
MMRIERLASRHLGGRTAQLSRRLCHDGPSTAIVILLLKGQL